MAEYFKPVEKEDIRYFKPFFHANSFGDTSFSLLYAWSVIFDYRYHIYNDAVIAVARNCIKNSRGFMLIRKNPYTSIHTPFNEICDYCRKNGIQPVFEYVCEEEIADYISAAKRSGKKIEYSSQEIYSDYIYKTADFISISGNRNKNKRGGYNYFIKRYPEIRCEIYRPRMYGDILKIFDSWCGMHACKDCFYGCERIVFERFMKIYDSQFHKISIAYHGIRPLSFAVCEQINRNTICYYFQKNAERIRGLTYWLNRQMAIEHKMIQYIDLGEDMGIKGLAMDKRQLHPCAMKKKYTVIIS